MRKVSLFIIVGALLWAGSAEAAIMFKNALAPLIVNNLEDDNAEILIDSDGSGTVTASDFILTIFTSPVIDPEGVPPPPTTSIGVGTGYNELTGVSLIHVDTVDLIGNGATDPGNGILHDDFTFNAPTLGEWTAITSLFGPGITPTTAGTMAMVWDDAAQDFFRDGTIVAGLASASGGTLAWEWGMSGLAVADPDGVVRIHAAPGEGWRANAPVAFVFSGMATFEFALDNLLTGPAGVPLLPTTQFGGVAPFGGPLAKVQGSGDLEPASATSGFAVFSDTDIYISPVPEPASLIIWGLLGTGCAGGALASRRRRRAPWSDETRQNIHQIIDRGRTNA